MIEKYTHHNREVYTQSEIKGQHRKYCLCFQCAKLNIEERENNCSIANDLYANCVKYGITTPVFECPNFVAL